MNPEIAKLLNNTLPTALAFVLGSVPLIGVIGWTAFQQENRFKRAEDQQENRFKRLEDEMKSVNGKLDKLIEAIGALTTQVALLNQRVDQLESHRIVSG